MRKLESLTKFFIQIIVHVYLLMIIVILPYYAPGGYVKLGENKFHFFKMVGMECFGMMIPAAVVLLVCQGKKAVWKLMSATDWAVLLYMACVVLSYICTEWKKQAFWGAEGWMLGLVSQLMFCGIYFYVSRFSEKLELWYAVFLVASFGVFLLGLLNRFSLYPLWMEPDAPSYYISTIGNINWFCGYWSVVFPIGLVLHWSGKGDTLWKKTGLMLYIVMGFMVGIVQGSSSGFGVLGVVFVILFLLSFEENGLFLRWLELMLLFAVSVLLISAVKWVSPTALNYENEMEEWLTRYPTGGFILGVAIICYAAARFILIRQQKNVKTVRRRVYRTAIALALLMGLLLTAAVVYYNVIFVYDDSFAASLFRFDTQWGNGRGASWTAALRSFASMLLLHKIVGIGPDCFECYVYSNPAVAEELYAVFGIFRLTNAHNELLTTLVNIGIGGAVSYAAIFATALLFQFRAGRREQLLWVSAVCIAAYVFHNLVSFQQITSTPFVFLIIGFGERLLREIREEK